MAKIYYKSEEEILKIKESSLLVGKAHAVVAEYIEPGVQTSKLDKLAEEFILDNGGKPAFKGYQGFPFTLCISPNDVVVHGFPSTYELRDGDIISVDCGVILDGYFGDSAYTYTVGEVKEDVKKLLQVTKECLSLGIQFAKQGNRLGDISSAIQENADKYGFGVVRELVGHGVGIELHEEPQVPNYGKKGKGVKLSRGIVIAVEPMINMGTHKVLQLKDGWTIKTADGLPSAHFEHTIAVGKNEVEILSTFEYIEEVLRKKNIEVL
jgi:methionyl aminopeptidase